MVVKFTINDKGNPPGKLADAELHFLAGPLSGLKLVGFAIWERRNGTGRNVTFPARQYSVNGERRSFALLRPVVDQYAQDGVRDLILQAFEAFEADALAQAATVIADASGFGWAPSSAPVVDHTSEPAAREAERPAEAAPAAPVVSAAWF